jgi:tetratricopeptide (TPR) repeat protein
MGWAYYRFGDFEKALQLSTESLEAATQLGYVYERENELTNIGYIQMDEQKFDQAGQSFRKALDLAEGIEAFLRRLLLSAKQMLRFVFGTPRSDRSKSNRPCVTAAFSFSSRSFRVPHDLSAEEAARIVFPEGV